MRVKITCRVSLEMRGDRDQMACILGAFLYTLIPNWRVVTLEQTQSSVESYPFTRETNCIGSYHHSTSLGDNVGNFIWGKATTVVVWLPSPLPTEMHLAIRQTVFSNWKSLGQTNKRKEFISCASINTNQICDENSENLRR